MLGEELLPVFEVVPPVVLPDVVGVEVPVELPAGPDGGGGVGPLAEAVGASGFVVLGLWIVVPTALAGWAGAAGGTSAAASWVWLMGPSPARTRSLGVPVLRVPGRLGAARSRRLRALS